MSKQVQVSSHFSWFGLLGIIFVLCKVFEYGPIADWSWWLVLLPFYLGLAIVLTFLLIAAVIAIIVS
jgi:small Trp-rich protein